MFNALPVVEKIELVVALPGYVSIRQEDPVQIARELWKPSQR